MSQSTTEPEYNYDQGETEYSHREYEIQDKNNKYNLKLETTGEKIYFKISSSNNMAYNYKTDMDLSTIVDKLSLNSKKYSNFEQVLNLFDRIHKNEKLTIKENDDKLCTLLVQLINASEEENIEISLPISDISTDDKFNILFNEIQQLRNKTQGNNNNDNINSTINELNNNLNKKDKEIEDLINSENKKDNIINEMKDKITQQENKINEIKDKNNKLDNKYENILKIIDEKFSNIENDIKNKLTQINNKINDNNDISNEINKIKNKITQQEKKIEKSILDNINEMINTKINNKFNEFNKKENQEENRKNINEGGVEEIDLKTKDQNNTNDIEYEQKINHEFIKDPKDLKFNSNITTTNTKSGWNDMFEIFISCKDNKAYLASPNSANYNIDIFSLETAQKLLSRPGHKNNIKTIRYFIDNKKKNEYLISGDKSNKEQIVIIWDVTNNYDIKYNINTQYGNSIYSCLMIFPENTENNDEILLITSSYYTSKTLDKAATKVYSLKDNNYNLIRYFEKTNKISVYYLLPWHNKQNNKLYIIQLCDEEILINNLNEDKLSFELINKPESQHYSGFIYSKNNVDYLCSSSNNGYINIWDLYSQKIYKTFDTNGCQLAHIIEWNKKFFIVADIVNKVFKIIDTEDESISDFKTDHTEKLICIKKIYHPIHGESLLSAGRDKIIKLWTFE